MHDSIRNVCGHIVNSDVNLTSHRINGVLWSDLNETYGSVAAKTRAFVIAAIMIGLASIAGAVFIMADKFLQHDDAYKWAGISVFVQCLLIFVRYVN